MIKKILLLIYGLCSLFWLQAQSPGGVSTNLQRWYRADGTTTVVSGAVSQWNDMSGNNVHLTQATAANRPAQNTSGNLINFNPSLSFDGTNDNLRNATGAAFITGSGGYTAYYIATSNGNPSAYVISHGANNENGFKSGTAATATSKTSGGNVFATIASSWSSTPSITRTGFNGGATQPYYLSSNSSAESTSANATPNVAANAPLTIGARPDGSTNYWNGAVSEVIWYSGKHAAANYNRVESYLALKYGITKAGNYINSASATVWTSGAGYDNNIAGIARDDMGGAANSGLNQKQSQSQNSGIQPVIGNANIAATNPANTNNFSANLSSLIWGSDAGSTNFATAFAFGGLNNRMARIWKVQETGTVGSVKVALPASQLPSNMNNFTLVVSSDATFDGTDTRTAMTLETLGGVQYYTATVDFTTGQFFTFAGIVTYPGGVASGLNLWMKGDAGFSTSQWLDQSGSGYIFQQNTVANQPAATGTMNFNTAIRFDGVDDFMDITSVAGLMNGSIDSDRTVSMALRSSAATNSAIADFDGTCGGNGDLVLFWQGTVRPDLSPCGTGQANYVSTLASANINIINSHTFANATGAVFIYRNYLQTNAVTSAAVASGLTTGTLGRTGAAVSYDGSLGEFIIHNRVLNNTERQQVDSYLAMRYANTLGTTASPVSYLASDGTTTIWTGSATYQNNVSGIGRDDLSGLYQKQSQSTNTGSQVVMALGTAAASNPANANTIPTDKQFFIWGDDNGSLTTQVTTGNNTYTYRFTRVWRTQNTGSFAENMTVYYPVSAFGNALPATVALLYGTSAASLSNGTASAIAQSGTTTINGTSYYAFTVPSAQVANMQFFSFAGTQAAPGGVTGGALWLRADTGTNTTANGGTITTWNDQSGNNRNFTNAAGTVLYQTPISNSGFNFNPSLNFSTTSSALSSASSLFPASPTSNMTFFGICNVNTFQLLSVNANSETITTAFYDYPSFYTNLLFARQNSTNSVTVTNNIITGTISRMATGVFTNGTTASLSINGGTPNTSTGTYSTTTGGMSIGADTWAGGDDVTAVGNTPEVIAYIQQLTTAEQLRVESYLAVKYGITKAGNYQNSGSTVIWTNDATYQNNIAGIGRDDLSALYQKQSQSVNSGSQVVMAIGTAAASNQANANTITADKQFFIWGNDNGSITSIVSTGNSTYPYRLTRVWKTQNTGTFAENLTVYYPVSAFGNAPASTVALLYGTTAVSLNNGTASAIAQSGTTTINGTSYYVFTVPSAQVANMQFFSFAALVTAPGGVVGADLWLKANTGTSTTTDGVAMSQWGDQSGNANNVLQGTAANMPLYRSNNANLMNFNPTVSFDGTNDFMDATTFTINGSANSLFSAVKPNVVNVTQDVLGFGTVGSTVGGELRLNNAALEYGQINPTFVPVTSGSVVTAGTPLLFGSSMNNGTSGTSLYQNNKIINTGAIDQIPSSADVVSIGSRTVVSRALYFNGLIPEVIAYNSLLSAVQRQQIDSYLAIKYGITLDQSTVFNFNNGDFSTGDFSFWSATGNVDASGNNARFNASNTTPNGVISQTISTVNGQSYTVGGDVTRVGLGAGTARVRLDVIDNSTSVVIATQNITAASATATPFTPLAFTGNGNSFSIRFTDTSTATVSLDIILDNVTLTPNASATGKNYLSSASGIIWNATTNSSYNNNIAGISRDDASALNQKQSQSVNSGIQPVIGNVNIAATNAANTNNFSADLSALVWGSDTGSTSFAASFVFGGLNNRMTRIWKVQETGTVGTVKVALPVSQLAPNVSQLNLVVSSDAVFDGTDTRTAMTLETLGGVQYYTATVDFTTGQFFTFAALVTSPGGVITGLRQWLKADAGTSTTTAGSGVATWADQSGNGFDALQSSAALAPLYRTAASANKYNFNPYLDYSGGKGSYNAGTSAAIFSSDNDNASIFVMSQGYTTGGTGVGSPWAVGFNTSGTAYLDQGKFGFSNSSTSMLWTRASGSTVVASSGLDDQSIANQIYVIDWNGATSTTKSTRARQNGRIVNSAANTNPLTIGTNTTNQFGISDGGNGSIAGDNNMGTFFTSEMIAYNAQLTELEMSRVNSYLAIKYGKTLSRDNNGNGTAGQTVSGSILEGDYVASDGTTRVWNSDAVYLNNIAGIGRDDISALNQKQSQSVNSGSQVVMALGTAAASNQANANTITADKQFFIWGDDNGSITSIVSTGNGTYSYRLTRIWKAQNTGSFAENITVYYPVAAFGSAPASTVALLYGSSAASLSNGTASAIAQSGTTTINGTSYYAFTVPSAEIVNMQFFSFAGTQTAPGGIMGQALWLRADVGTSTTTNGAALSQWNDQSLNANNVTQATAANRPTYRNNTTDNVNFNPVIRFDGTNDRLNGAADILPDNSQQLSFSGVYRSSATTGNILASSNITNGPDDGLIISTGVADAVINRTSSLFVLAGDGSINTNNSISSGSSSFPINTLTLSSFVKTGATTGAIFSRGLALATTGSINNPMSFSNQTTQLVIGSGTDPDATYSPFFNGVMGDVIVYGSNLTAAQRLRVESYLAIKYGLTLGNTSSILNYTASDGTTILWTGNATYQNNIAGIGRDDLSGLYQKQSQSVNSGSQVVMALGTAAASNPANANTIATDKQFFIWGDDNGSLTTQVTTGNNTYTYRFTRVWRAQNTGSFAENMTVYYPVSAFGNALPSTVALLYGTSAASLNNGTASAIAQSGTTTINGTSYYAFTVPSAQVANMQFFSFAALVTAPGGVVGADLWLKADIGTSTTTDGVAMSQWDDQSGNANNVLQGTAANMPLYRSNNANLMNFNPTVSFDGTNDFMDATFTINGATNTLFSAVKPNVVNVTQDILGFGAVGSNNGGEFRFNNATLQYGQNNNAVFVAITSGSVLTAGTPLLFGSSMNNAANGANLYQNNRNITTGTIAQIPSAANLVSIGSRTINSRNFYFNGFIPEVITYNSLLTAAQRQRVNTYLAIKYGITMDQTAATDYLASDGTTILWNGTSNAVYNKNIAGIGRDDLSALYQKQSQSINSGSQVVMALGTAAASNQANANTIPTDKQFLIWGDDNGSITSIVSTGNGTYSYRLTRIWKAQNTGSFAENITVYYPVSAFGNAQASTVALLYGTSAVSLNNGTASAIAQSGTTTINGTSYYAFTVPSAQVANMQFFSFTGTQTVPGGVAGVNLWLKADAGTSTTTNGATLSTWADQSGQRVNLATTSSGVQTFKNNTADNINFNPAVYFDGLGGLNFGNDYIFTPAGNGGVTLFAANRPDNTAATKLAQNLFDFGEGTGIAYSLVYSNNNSTLVSPTGFGGVATNSSTTNGIIPTIIGGQINFSNNQYLIINGLQYGTTAITLPALTSTQISAAPTHGGGAGGGPVSIGRQSKSINFTNNDTRAYQGHLSEIIHYSSNLTDIQRLQVNTYLALKYGTTLTRDNNGNGTSGQTVSGSVVEGDYVASDGTTRIWNSDAVYLNNISGIGRDDLSALYQKQSQSVNTGSQVVMALGTAAASNQANANTIPTDKQFFIWGDDNGSLSNVLATGNTTYPYRFTRVWKTQNTGTFAQNMTVYYPVSAFGNASASTVALLYGTTSASLSNGTASAIAQSGTTSINGVSYYAFTVPSAQVANMQFFSFTGTQTAPGGIAGENLWYRADSGIAQSGGFVTQWDNQASSSYNLVQQGAAGTIPAYDTSSGLINFNPSVRFDGVDDRLYSPSVPQNVTISGSDPYATSQYVVYRGLSGSRPVYNHSNGAAGTWNVGAHMNGEMLVSNGIVSTTATAINEVRLQGFDGNSNAAGSYLNGTLMSNILNNPTAVAGTQPFWVGAAGTSGFANTSVAEVVIYNTAQASRPQIESYLGIKYGLTIGHNYLASDGTTTYDVVSHSNNIAGIGRDDLSALYQKQSQSQNTGSQVVVALGTAAASNQANANTIPTDKQLFVWGDNNLSLTTFVS
ncbi:beta strand repeat-containing protein, partial [Chryseobacterium profundimaris]